MNRVKQLGLLALTMVLLLMAVTPALAKEPKGPPGFGELYYEGRVVRTLVPPAAAPKTGVDDLYAVPGQRAVVAVAPGNKDYHGGKWAFHSVSWNVEPYLLTSAAEVLAAAQTGDVTITRVPENDFKCPVQP